MLRHALYLHLSNNWQVLLKSTAMFALIQSSAVTNMVRWLKKLPKLIGACRSHFHPRWPLFYLSLTARFEAVSFQVAGTFAPMLAVVQRS